MSAKDYKCPICLAVDGVESKETMIMQDDIFYRDDLIMALVNSKFVLKNPGHVIVVPLKHYENIYNLPQAEAERIMKVSKKVVVALKEIRRCDGITIQQNNEPAGGQHAFHYHMHVFPRFNDDEFYMNILDTKVSTPQDRKSYSAALKKHFS